MTHWIASSNRDNQKILEKSTSGEFPGGIEPSCTG